MSRLTVVLTIGCLLLGIAVGAEETPPETPSAAPSEEIDYSAEKGSYALGYRFGTGLLAGKVDLVSEDLLAGLEDALTGSEARFEENEIVILASMIQNDARRRQQAERAEQVARNRSEGEVFLAANQHEEGVVTLPSGLQYKVLEAGQGAHPGVEDTVTVHYRGTLIDGSPFDSSHDRGDPAVIRPDRVVPAWKEALPMMTVGSTWRLFARSDLAFGDNQNSSNIPPGATLIFDISLLSIEPRAEEVETPTEGADL